MAQTLGDIIFRRTGMGAAGDVPSAAPNTCAAAMGKELTWTAERIEREIADTRRALAAVRWSG